MSSCGKKIQQVLINVAETFYSFTKIKDNVFLIKRKEFIKNYAIVELHLMFITMPCEIIPAGGCAPVGGGSDAASCCVPRRKNSAVILLWEHHRAVLLICRSRPLFLPLFYHFSGDCVFRGAFGPRAFCCKPARKALNCKGFNVMEREGK